MSAVTETVTRVHAGSPWLRDRCEGCVRDRGWGYGRARFWRVVESIDDARRGTSTTVYYWGFTISDDGTRARPLD